VACPPRGYACGMERREAEVEQQGDFKNALPREVDDHPESGMPRQLRTQADDEPPLSRAEADVLGISPTPQTVYGETDEDQNREDIRDANRADPDEHV
jgi:hypothetical protein